MLISRGLRIEFQEVLDTTQENSEVGPARKGAFGPLIQRGMLCIDGMQWKQARNLVESFFAKGYLNDLGSTERHIKILLMAMTLGKDSGWTIEVTLLGKFSHSALDIFTDFSQK